MDLMKGHRRFVRLYTGSALIVRLTVTPLETTRPWFLAIHRGVPFYRDLADGLFRLRFFHVPQCV